MWCEWYIVAKCLYEFDVINHIFSHLLCYTSFCPRGKCVLVNGINICKIYWPFVCSMFMLQNICSKSVAFAHNVNQLACICKYSPMLNMNDIFQIKVVIADYRFLYHFYDIAWIWRSEAIFRRCNRCDTTSFSSFISIFVCA